VLDLQNNPYFFRQLLKQILGLPKKNYELYDARSGEKLSWSGASFNVPVKARNYTYVYFNIK